MIGCSKIFCDALGARGRGHCLQQVRGGPDARVASAVHNTMLGAGARQRLNGDVNTEERDVPM